MRKYIGHLIFKTMSTPNRIRIIEWQKMFKYLDAKEDERILEIRWSGKLGMGFILSHILCVWCLIGCFGKVIRDIR